MISIHHNEIQIIAIIKNLYKYFSEVKICCQSVKQLEYYNRQINTVYWILTINSSKRDSIPLQILNSNCFADFLQSILWGFIWGFSLELLNLQLKVLTTHYWPMFPFIPSSFKGYEMGVLVINEMRCTNWYHLYNLKNVKDTHGGMLLLVKLQAD